jgi:tRNA(Ile)-lysidine synthetase-like protein
MISLISEILPNKNQDVYIAVSMGVDSVAAMFYLSSHGYKLTPVHFNHKMRPQNDQMQENFRRMINDYGYEGRSEIGYGGRNLKTENDCRKARLEFFRNLPSKENKIIITAHHLDDYQESYLLNCFRGHPEYKSINLISDFGSFKIVHPFLLTEKKDFVQFSERFDKGKLKQYITQDETNDIIKGSRRNWIRNIIIPELTNQKISLKRFCRDQIDSQIQRLQFSGVFSP